MFETKVVEKTQTHFLHYNNFFLKNHAVNEIIWRNIVEPDRPWMTVWCTYIACWI